MQYKVEVRQPILTDYTLTEQVSPVGDYVGLLWTVAATTDLEARILAFCYASGFDLELIKTAKVGIELVKRYTRILKVSDA